jgi:hypothetical protein
VGIQSPLAPGSLDHFVSGLDLRNVDLHGGFFEIDPELDHGDWYVDTVVSPAGTTLRAGSVIEVTLAVPIAQMPDVTGKTVSEAKKLVRQSGLSWQTPKPTYDGTLPVDFELNVDRLRYNYWDQGEMDFLGQLITNNDWAVTSQSIAPGTITLRSKTVQLQTGWPSATVPDLTKMSGSDARTALHDAGLSWRDVAVGPDLIVESQTVPAGTVVPMGTRVGANVGHDITFSVTSSESTALITVTGPGESTIRQINPAVLPWETKWFPASLPDADNDGKLTAQLVGVDGWITCQVIVDGEVVELKRSSGMSAAVKCG